MRKREPHIQYVPLDDVLDRPLVRLLRTLRWFDWVDSDDLFEASGAPESYTDRQPYYQAIRRLIVARHIERRESKAVWSRRDRSMYCYRITASGRQELARRLITDTEIIDAPLEDREVAA